MAENLRWRRTHIRHWRKAKDMTLEEAAEALGRHPYKIETTHNSLGRVERGEQMPKIELIEALADLYGTDVDSLLNRMPGKPDPSTPPGSAKELMAYWDRADREGRELIAAIAARVLPKT